MLPGFEESGMRNMVATMYVISSAPFDSLIQDARPLSSILEEGCGLNIFSFKNAQIMEQ
jgi:hypothetical protein